MASNAQETPFVKHLAASDRPTREKALKSLETYLTSGRIFTNLELLKIWKGLFFCIHHTANPLPQQRLAQSLSGLLLALPAKIFVPFLSAFFQTIIAQWSTIPSLRLDKYLYLIRQYILHSFIYLSCQGWDQSLLDAWVSMMVGEVEGQKREGRGVMDPDDQKVGDGLRYHVLDVWVDSLVEVEQWEKGVERGAMKPVAGLVAGGVSKTLRLRAKGVMEDKRLGEKSDSGNDRGTASGDDDFEGFD